MTIHVRLFAIARERAGCDHVALDLAEPATVADLRAAIAERFPALRALLPSVLVAVDTEYASDDRALQAGVEVALIPPVSGGAPQP
jgi:molybdopterin converting factor subunit 1